MRLILWLISQSSRSFQQLLFFTPSVSSQITNTKAPRILLFSFLSVGHFSPILFSTNISAKLSFRRQVRAVDGISFIPKRASVRSISKPARHLQQLLQSSC